MALTHAQRTSMFNTLTEVMGQDDADALMQHLPPSNWDNVATKDDLRAGFAETHTALATGLAQAATERAKLTKTISEGLAQAATERAKLTKTISEGLAQAATERAEGFAKAAIERAEIKAEAAVERAGIAKTVTEGLAQAAIERAEIRAEAATERANIIRHQAWHLYVMVSTIVVATVSIWIALLTLPGASS